MSNIDWEKELQNELKGRKIKPKKRFFFSPILFFFVVTILIGNFIILERKHHYLTNMIYGVRRPVNKIDVNRILIAESKEELRIVKEKLKDFQDKMVLMAIVLDENSAIAKEITSENPKSAEFIHIDDNWKINRLPSRIIIDEKNKDLLQKHLK